MSHRYFQSFKGLSRLSRFRFSALRTLLVLALPLLIHSDSLAQFKFRQTPNRQDPDSLSPVSGQNLWDYFIDARNIGRFHLSGTLQYRPSNAASKYYDFQLNGNWNSMQQETSMSLTDADGTKYNKNVRIRDGEVIVQDEANGCDEVNDVKDNLLSQPLLEQLPFTLADILMPYLHWKPVTYLGPDRYLGRPAHRFMLTNPGPNDPVSKAIVTVDEDYAVLLKSDVLDKDDNILKRIRVRGFKQFNDQWMFSQLVWEHREKRESVVLNVDDFSINPN